MGNGVAVGVVFVVGGKGGRVVEDFGDVAVGVADGEGVGAGRAGLEEAADAARALEG